MNERRLLALLMLALVSFGFIACEEDESLKDRAAKLKGSHGYYFRTEDRSVSVRDTVDLYSGNFYIATAKFVDNNFNDIDVNNEVKYDFYFGKSPDRMEPVDAQDVNIDFLDVCYGKIVEYITSGDERCDVSEIGPFVIRYIPNNIYCETEYGKGGNNEFSNWIKVKLYYYDGTKKDENKKYIDNFSGKLTLSAVYPDTISYTKTFDVNGTEKIVVKGGEYQDAEIMPAYSISDFRDWIGVVAYSCSFENDFRIALSNNDFLEKAAKLEKADKKTSDKNFYLCDTLNYAFLKNVRESELYYIPKHRFTNKMVVYCDPINRVIENFSGVTNKDMVEAEAYYGIEAGKIEDYLILDWGHKFEYEKSWIEENGYVLGKGTNLFMDFISSIAKWNTYRNGSVDGDALVLYLNEFVTINGVKYQYARLYWPDGDGVVRCLCENEQVVRAHVQR